VHAGRFSADDIILGVEYSMTEVRVVTDRHRYFAWQLRAAAQLLGNLRSEFQKELGVVAPSVREDVRCDRVNARDFGIELVHRCWQRLHARFGFLYQMEES
jgi:hypothetical protein